jgi:mono/diheme cytochrome c family protein
MTQSAITLALVSAAVLAASAPSIAADATNGAKLAQQWCANCHVVGSSASPSLQQGPPNFSVIARDLAPARVRTSLIHPHKPMPDLSLSRSEIDDLVAYIDTLR